MAVMPTALQAAVRAANALGALLNRSGLPLASLDEQHLLAAARRRTQLDDFGDDDFRAAVTTFSIPNRSGSAGRFGQGSPGRRWWATGT